MMRKLLLISLVLGTLNGYSQVNTLKLRSGNYHIKTAERYAQTGNLPSNQFFSGKYYMLASFEELPSDALRKQLTQSGIDFISYLPDRVYLVGISASASVQNLYQAGASDIVPFLPKQKMQHELAAETYPKWAMVEDLVAVNFSIVPEVNEEEALQYVTSKGIQPEINNDFSGVYTTTLTPAKIEELGAIPFVTSIEPIDPPAKPENLSGTTLHRSNVISNEFVNSVPYNGSGVWVALGDDGEIGPHIDYKGRFDQSNAGASSGNHGDHIAGTIMGAGNLDPVARGMAWGADLMVYNVWNAVNNTPTSYFSPGVVVTSTSYSNGCNAGYTNFARTVDQQIRQMPNLMHVFSAGNNGTADCSYGAGSGWGNVTGGVKVGKNVIAVGNLSDEDVLANSSSRGPAADGRIKPELCAMGSSVYSTYGGNIYATISGTSMAAPGVSGTYAQLVQAYRELNGGTTPTSDILKNALMNTAEDLGNAGPDFKFGYGRINASRALEVIENNQFVTGSITQGQSVNIPITVPSNATGVKIMVYWNDYEANANAAVALVNDINMTVSTPMSGTLQPLVLDHTPSPTNLDAPATQGVDNLNNTEQVVVSNPTAGTYTVNLSGFNIPYGPQDYVVSYYFETDEVKVTYPIGGESVVPGINELIRWDAAGTNGSFSIELSTDNGASWSSLGTASATERAFNWNPASVVTGEALVRVTRNGVSDQSDMSFNIINVPSNLQITYICPDSLGFQWNAVSGATAYEVFVLGTNYMEPVDTVTTNYATVYGLNPSEVDWLSVRALANGVYGRRAYAIEKPIGAFNCTLDNDIAVREMIAPNASPLTTCTDLSALQVKAVLENMGQTSQTGFNVSYQLQNGSIVTETYSGTLQPGDTAHYTFNATVNLNTAGYYEFSLWSDLAGDQNLFNDTIENNFWVLSGSGTAQFPIYEDFEPFSNCGTNSDCGSTDCGLINGWENLQNGIHDDIDWRTNSGSTPSASTGPNFDYDPGTSSGKYLYLESSNCYSSEAILLSPCIDLTNAVSPELKFGYHMDGSTMGELHIDVLVDGGWILDVTSPISDDYGVFWQEASVNLSFYTGKIIVIRFRGITGENYYSDMALDGISIDESTTIPEVEFSASDESICQGQDVTFYDESIGAPNTWNWTITPSTGVSFVNGTSSSSNQPTVEFSQSGLYTIKLVASNSLGTDSLEKVDYIEVLSTGNALPLTEDFEAGTFPPANGWAVINPDNDYTWELSSSIVGADGNSTIATFVDNYSYNEFEEDALELPMLDLSNVNSAYMTFDVAYAQYQSYADGLRIDVSTDCGVTFNQSAYLKEGAVLATSPAISSYFSPSQASDWRNDTLDLSPYAGNSVIIRFVNINAYGNSLYLDNVNIVDNSGLVAQIASEEEVCMNDTIVFEDNSQGVSTSIVWDFGTGATPATASGVGPHSVVYNSVGTKQVDLTVSNSTSSDVATQQVEVYDMPQAGFSQNLNVSTLTLTLTANQVSGTSTWDFGDGSALQTGSSVSHTYTQKGIYPVTHYITNVCGIDSVVTYVTVAPDAIEELAFKGVNVYPNPARNTVTVDLGNNQWENYTIVITDITGRRMPQKFTQQNTSKALLNVGTFAQGIYLITLETKEGYRKTVRLSVIE